MSEHKLPRSVTAGPVAVFFYAQITFLQTSSMVIQGAMTTTTQGAKPAVTPKEAVVRMSAIVTAIKFAVLYHRHFASDSHEYGYEYVFPGC